MASTFGQRVMRAAAVLAVALGFLIIGIEVYRHVVVEGGGVFQAAWFVVAGVMILLGGLELDPFGVRRVLKSAGEFVTTVGPFIRRLGGGAVEVTPGTRAGEPGAAPPGAPEPLPSPVVVVPAVPPVPTPEDPRHG